MNPQAVLTPSKDCITTLVKEDFTNGTGLKRRGRDLREFLQVPVRDGPVTERDNQGALNVNCSLVIIIWLH